MISCRADVLWERDIKTVKRNKSNKHNIVRTPNAQDFCFIDFKKADVLSLLYLKETILNMDEIHCRLQNASPAENFEFCMLSLPPVAVAVQSADSGQTVWNSSLPR